MAGEPDYWEDRIMDDQMREAAKHYALENERLTAERDVLRAALEVIERDRDGWRAVAYAAGPEIIVSRVRTRTDRMHQASCRRCPWLGDLCDTVDEARADGAAHRHDMDTLSSASSAGVYSPEYEHETIFTATLTVTDATSSAEGMSAMDRHAINKLCARDTTPATSSSVSADDGREG